ncbi:hypothetical protein ACHAW5_007969 [Stephanodiscus triporus]|uniref:Uncharacterized protein n=1 Tax=Stephanodiscus triporus TaxID=2934178 RepID=A0ABD3N258_9STRA
MRWSKVVEKGAMGDDESKRTTTIRIRRSKKVEEGERHRDIRRQLSRRPYLVTRGSIIAPSGARALWGFKSDAGHRNCTAVHVALVRGDPARGVRSRGVDDRARMRSSNDDDEYGGKVTVNLPIKVKEGGIEIEKDALTDFYFLSSMSADDDDDAPEDGRCQRPRDTYAGTCEGADVPRHRDVEHGDSRVNRHWRKSIGLDRLGLHRVLTIAPRRHRPRPSPRWRIECLAPLTLDFAGPLKHEKLGPLWAEACRVEPRLGMEPYDERGGTFGRNYRRRR